MKINQCPLSTDTRRLSICVTKLFQFHVLASIQIVLGPEEQSKLDEFVVGLWQMEQYTLKPQETGKAQLASFLH